MLPLMALTKPNRTLQDMELVVDDGAAGDHSRNAGPEGLPHIHASGLDAVPPSSGQFAVEELVQGLLAPAQRDNMCRLASGLGQ